MSHLRKDPDAFYAYPAHLSPWRWLLWRLGFDPLTLRERLAQVRREAADWKRWGQESAEATFRVWGAGRNEVEWGDAIRTEIARARESVGPNDGTET